MSDKEKTDASVKELMFVEYRRDREDERREWLQYSGNESEWKEFKELHMDKWVPSEQESLDDEAIMFDSRRVWIAHPVLGSLLSESQVLFLVKHSDQRMTKGQLKLPRLQGPDKNDQRQLLDHAKIQATRIRAFFS